MFEQLEAWCQDEVDSTFGDRSDLVISESEADAGGKPLVGSQPQGWLQHLCASMRNNVRSGVYVAVLG